MVLGNKELQVLTPEPEVSVPAVEDSGGPVVVQVWSPSPKMKVSAMVKLWWWTIGDFWKV